jgi:hypothetical protein
MIVVGAGFSQGQTVVKVEDEETLILNEGITDTLEPATPLEFVGVNYVYWTLVVPSVSWKSFWTNTTQYVVNELVIWQNATYRCIKNHTATLFFRPDNDVNNQFWVVYAIHAKENAGNTAGDIVTFTETGTEAVPILPVLGDAGDTENYLFRVSDIQPNWKKMFQLPDVYYVATNGVDMINLNLTILGDPYYLATSGTGNYTATATNFQNLTSDGEMNYQNGEVYTHRDPDGGDGVVTYRCNVLTQANEDGAELYVGGNKVDIEVGDLHCYAVSEIGHGVTEAKGITPRIMWMFGAHTPKEYWTEKH